MFEKFPDGYISRKDRRKIARNDMVFHIAMRATIAMIGVLCTATIVGMVLSV